MSSVICLKVHIQISKRKTRNAATNLSGKWGHFLQVNEMLPGQNKKNKRKYLVASVCIIKQPSSIVPQVSLFDLISNRFPDHIPCDIRLLMH